MTVEQLLAEPLVTQGVAPAAAARCVRAARNCSGWSRLAPENLCRATRTPSPAASAKRIAIARSLALQTGFHRRRRARVRARRVGRGPGHCQPAAPVEGRQLQLTMLFIGHDLAVVEIIADRIAVDDTSAGSWRSPPAQRACSRLRRATLTPKALLSGRARFPILRQNAHGSFWQASCRQARSRRRLDACSERGARTQHRNARGMFRRSSRSSLVICARASGVMQLMRSIPSLGAMSPAPMNRITREAPHEPHHFGDRLRQVRRVIPSTFRLTHRHYSIVTPSNHRVARKFERLARYHDGCVPALDLNLRLI